MVNTFDEAVGVIAENTFVNKQNIEQKDFQRRHNFVDLYGVEYTRQGDGGAPATFYISISTDMVYLERFEFKLIVQPFVSTVSSNGIQSATVTVNSRSLSANYNYGSVTISPNPHNHTTQPHTHNVVSGVSMTHTTASDFRVSIEGVDITAYLMAQYGSWISGEGVYPSIDIGKDYDILEVASDLVAQGRMDDADKLTSSGYKRVEISSDSPFQVTLVNYLKYSHMNR